MEIKNRAFGERAAHSANDTVRVLTQIASDAASYCGLKVSCTVTFVQDQKIWICLLQEQRSRRTAEVLVTLNMYLTMAPEVLRELFEVQVGLLAEISGNEEKGALGVDYDGGEEADEGLSGTDTSGTE